MATGSARTPQQRDAHELARTPQANPYRGAMLDPFATASVVESSPPASASPTAEAKAAVAERPVRSFPPAPPWASTATPAAATIAGVLGLALSLTMAL